MKLFNIAAIPVFAVVFFFTLIRPVLLYAADGDAVDCVTSQQTVADGKVFDTQTGRDTRNYAPDPQADFTHLKLEIRMVDPTSKSFTATETLSFAATRKPISRLQLDAVGLSIKSVADLSGKALTYRSDDEHVYIELAAPLAAGAASGLLIEYACTDPKMGMIFALPEGGYAKRPLTIHTQGEAQTNRYWFVSHDYPNDRFTSEIAVTIPSKYVALSNGALVSKTKTPNEKLQEQGDLTTWHYSLGRPHVSYLVSLVVGDFDVVTDTWRGKPVEYWVPKGTPEADVRRTFGKTPKMLEFFSTKLGVDYPYEKYAQSVVYDFAAGGMENTSTTTLTETCVMDERSMLDGDQDGLISHELGHQWFGDMLTCRNWSHLWLNEGFATYMDNTWSEHEFGQEEYAMDLWRNMRGVAANDDGSVRGGVVWPYYSDPEETFRRGPSNPYGKGSSVLHMLRRSLGDDLFWQCIGEYARRNAWKNVETDDLRKVVDELSGRSYDRFFQQWIYRAGSPNLRVNYDYDDDAHEATIKIDQTQPINENAPAFDLDVDVLLVDESGKTVRGTVHTSERSASGRIACPFVPKQVIVDPDGAVLAKWDVNLPKAMQIAAALNGPTPTSRLSAIASLGTIDTPVAREALKTILLDANQFYGYRNEAATSLGKMQQPAARQVLLAALADAKTIANAKVRRSAVNALGQYRDAEVADALVRYASADASYGVESAALGGLGNQVSTPAIVDVLLAGAAKPSYRDQLRANAIGSLADLGEVKGIYATLALTKAGESYRTRPNAIATLARLGLALEKDDKTRDMVRDALVELSGDPMQRVRYSAINALGTFGDVKAIPVLRKIESGSTTDELKTRAHDAIDAINKKGGESPTLSGLRDRIEALEKAKAEIEKRLPPTTAPTTKRSEG